VSTSQTLACKVVPHAGHMKMQVTHIPAHRTDRGAGFTAGSQEPAEERIMAQQKKEPPSLIKNIVLAGTAAVITVNGIHPIDVVKTRLQIQGEAGR